MKSHAYEFTKRDLFHIARMPLAVCLAFTLLTISDTNFFPAPKPILDTDRTILIHQAEASRTASSADIILIGDSSCLMDVNARQLSELTGKRVLNLGTLSHVELNAHAYLLRAGLDSNATQTIVVLMHPESLRLAARAAYFSGVIYSYFKGTSFSPNQSVLLRTLGIYEVRDRVLPRALPIPLAGEYGQYYGFNQNLWNHLTQNNGSALDPHTYPATTPAGNPEYRLAAQLESASKDFSSRLPPNTRLIVGITPSPSDYVYRNHSENCRAMLATWSQWLNAEVTLTNLPFILPPTHFATTTHLNALGVSEYTRLLAEQLTAPK